MENLLRVTDGFTFCSLALSKVTGLRHLCREAARMVRLTR